jgi:hypothetical protein
MSPNQIPELDGPDPVESLGVARDDLFDRLTSGNLSEDDSQLMSDRYDKLVELIGTLGDKDRKAITTQLSDTANIKQITKDLQGSVASLKKIGTVATQIADVLAIADQIIGIGSKL